MRKIPATMVSQHPDNANAPYWYDNDFISTQQETKECFLSFLDLGAQEYKWDWEGKLVDESVIERLFSEYYEYFKKNPLGVDKFLTFRLPNPRVETEFRLGRAFMGILSASVLAKQLNLHTPPLFEVILPMTESAEEMLDIQEAFNEMASLKHPLYKFDEASLKNIELIPLFESTDTIVTSHFILKKYLELYKQKFGSTPSYLRPYLARSDPALNSGLIPTVLAIKIALSNYKNFEKQNNIKLFPILGAASLPFRGGLTPKNVQEFTNEYRGIRTILLQSAFRYDFDKNDVISAINELNKTIPQGQAVMISETEEKKLREIMTVCENSYRPTVEGLAEIINKMADFVPKKRERVQHIGLFGYSRGVGKVKLPRAITFTASLYSLGVPPELIGTGRAIKKLKVRGDLELVEKHYINLKSDLLRAGRFVNKDNLKRLSQASSVWLDVLEDIQEIEKYLGVELGPDTPEEKEHALLVSKIYQNFVDHPLALPPLLQQAAILRKSLG